MSNSDQKIKDMGKIIFGLFDGSVPQIFDRSNISAPLIDEFSNNPEAQKSAELFIKSLINIWENKYPKKELKLKKNKIHTVKTTYSSQQKITQSSQNNIKNKLQPGDIPHSKNPIIAPQKQLPSFVLSNGKVGEKYESEISCSSISRCSVQSLLLPKGLGLSYDKSTQILSGIPKISGEFLIELCWINDEKIHQKGTVSLIIIANPKDLWKSLEPDESAPYRKEHEESTLIAVDGYKILAGSKRGRSHAHNGSFRDDDYFVYHDEDSKWSVIIVADGAGSAKYSREGSKLASQTFGNYLITKLTSEIGDEIKNNLSEWRPGSESSKAVGDKFHYLFLEAATKSIDVIYNEAESYNSNFKEYSTTLLACAFIRDNNSTFLATFWVGDGAIAAYGPHGKLRLMGAPDGGEYAGQTRFLSREILTDTYRLPSRIKTGKYDDIYSIMLMTDGISDPRFETDNGLSNAILWEKLWDELSSVLSSENPEQELLKWLDFFSPGNHDDRTIALIW